MSVLLQVPVKTNCYHCGLACETNHIKIEGTTPADDKYFCCEGCKSVYEILNANDLCAYYTLENAPGTTYKKPVAAHKFDYLNNEAVKRALVNFSDGKQSKVVFSIPQIHCSSCIWLLENLYKLNPAITHSTVNFPRKELYLSFNEAETTLREVVILLASIGYEPDIRLGNLDSPAGQPGRQAARQLAFKLGLAGFCFGNIMLLSFPEYLGLSKQTESSFSQFFGILNIVLSLPVVLYSSSYYFSSAVSGLRQRTLNIDIPIALGIVVLFARSVYEIVTHTGAGYLDSLAGLVFFLLTGRWFQQKTYDSISFERDYKSYFPVSATRIQNSQEQSVSLNELEPDDVIMVRNEELIPADAVLVKGEARIDYSFVTGESEPVHKPAGSLIYAGGRQIGPAIELRLVKKVQQSYLTQLWNNDAFTGARHSNLTLLVNQTSRIFTPFILTVALVAGGYWYVASGVAFAVNVFTAVLIIACPCALALASPFTLGNAMRILGRYGFYLKNTAVIEQIAQVKQIVFDKTGTITQAGQSHVTFSGNGLTPAEEQYVKSAVGQSGHPISRQISHALAQVLPLPVSSYAETPGQGIEAVVNGQTVRIGSAQFAGVLPGEQPVEGEGGGNTKTFVSINGRIKGYYLFKNTWRRGLPDVLRHLSENYRLSLISGDNDGERQTLHGFFGRAADLLFNQTPQNKLNYIGKLRSTGQAVLMLGDGLNDAGALKQADVGIAVSENINNFSPACDAILQASEFERLHLLLQYCRTSVKLVRMAFLISLCYNLAGLSIAVQGWLSPLVAAIFMPLSSVTVVLFGFIATNIAARKVLGKTGRF